MSKEMSIEEVKIVENLLEDSRDCGQYCITRTELDAIEKVLAEIEKHIEKKDKQIDLMAKYILQFTVHTKKTAKFCNDENCFKDKMCKCEQCIEQYFKRKAEEE